MNTDRFPQHQHQHQQTQEKHHPSPLPSNKVDDPYSTTKDIPQEDDRIINPSSHRHHHSEDNPVSNANHTNDNNTYNTPSNNHTGETDAISRPSSTTVHPRRPQPGISQNAPDNDHSVNMETDEEEHHHHHLHNDNNNNNNSVNNNNNNNKYNTNNNNTPVHREHKPELEPSHSNTDHTDGNDDADYNDNDHDDDEATDPSSSSASSPSVDNDEDDMDNEDNRNGMHYDPESDTYIRRPSHRSLSSSSNLQYILNNDDTDTSSTPSTSQPSSPTSHRGTVSSYGTSGSGSGGDVLRYGPPPSTRRGVDEGPDVDDPKLAEWNINTKELRLAFNFIKKNILFEGDQGQQLVSTATWNRKYAVVEYQTGLYLLRKMKMVRPKDAKIKKRVSVLEPYESLGAVRDALETKFRELFPDEDPNKITDDYKKTTRRRRKSKQSDVSDAYNNSNLIGMPGLAGVPGMHHTGVPVAINMSPGHPHSTTTAPATTTTTTNTIPPSATVASSTATSSSAVPHTGNGSHDEEGRASSMYVPTGLESSSESLKRQRGSEASPLDMEEMLRPKRRQRIAHLQQMEHDIQSPYTFNGEHSGMGEIVYTAEEVKQLTRFLHDEHRTHLLGKENAGHLIAVKELADAELLSPQDEKLCLQILLSKTPHQKYLNILSAIEVHRAGHVNLFERIINYVLHST